MMKLCERRTIRLPWDQVCSIISDLISDVLDVQVSCSVIVNEDEAWGVEFVDYRMPQPQLCTLVQMIHPTLDDWEDALPDEGGVDVKDIGMYIAEKLMSNYLHLVWEHHIIASDGLWLVGVNDVSVENQEVSNGYNYEEK